MGENKIRLNYLDMSKGFGILLVIAGHIYERNSFAEVWIYSFHMPLFFIISGMLLNYSNINDNMINIIKKKIKSIILPYFTFEIVAIIIYLIESNLFTLEAIRWSVIDCILVYYCRAGATWFLPCLFVAEILFVVLKKYIKNDKIIVIISLGLYIISLIINTEKHFLILLLKSLNGLGFIMFGYYMLNYIQERKINKIYLGVLFILSIILAKLNGEVVLNELKFNNIFLYTVTSIIGSMLIIFIFKNIKYNKFLIYFGKNSLIIMATHLIIQRYFIDIITGINRYDYFEGTIVFIIAVIIQIPIIEIINKYLPFMIGKCTKKNTQTITD